MIGALGNAAARFRAAVDAGIFAGGTPAGALEILSTVVRGDFHPSAVWRLHAANLPGKLAVVAGDRRLTWQALHERINRVANGFLGIGVGPGDVVAVMLENSIEWLETFAAAGRIGASPVFVSYRAAPPELEYIVRHSGAALLVFGARHAGVVEAASPSLGLPSQALVEVGGAGSGRTSYDDLVSRASAAEPPRDLRTGASRVILYTSGTTGRPKGAVRDLARAGLGALVDILRVIPFRRSDRHLVCAPLYHATGSGFATLHVSLGATLVLMERFDAEQFLRIVERERITTTALVPTMLRSLLALSDDVRRSVDLSSLRVVVSTGSALSPALRKSVREWLGPVLYDLYGATEMGWVAVATPEDQLRKPGSVGRPVPGTDVVLLGDAEQRARKPVPDGTVGELFARNELTVEGYHADEEATRKSRWNGYFSVGDLAVRDAEGYLTLVDRKSDMVISGGMNIYPAEVERVLTAHPGVAEAAVIGVPDEHWGESLVAFVVPRPGADLAEAELEAHCRRELAGYKVPRRIRFLDALPHNPTGKILKSELRARVASVETSDSS